MATWQMCGHPRLIIVVLAVIRAQYGALTDGYDLASQMISCAVSAPATLVRYLSWLVLSKEEVRMALKKFGRSLEIVGPSSERQTYCVQRPPVVQVPVDVSSNSYSILKFAPYTPPHVRKKLVRHWTQRHAV
jgi:hypothetical protein